MAAHRLMQLVPSSTRATDLRVRPCAPDVDGEEITWPSVMLVDLDPHPAPTPLNSTVSISETRLPYIMASAWIAHVKQYAKTHNISYKDALKKAGSTYTKTK